MSLDKYAFDNTIFPTEKEIPAQYRIDPIIQRQYLLNGKLETWSGSMQEVVSPVMIRGSDGSLTQKILGSYPLMDEQRSLDALDSSAKAYNGGRGYWPTMSVQGRLKHGQDFVNNMKKVREEVSTLLSLEIGKSVSDAYKEFDRTVEYVEATIKAIKTMYSESSKLVSIEGILAQIRRSPLGKNLSMGPYNYPLNETYTTLIPSVLMGNTIIFKPAKYGVLLHEPLLKAYQQSFPEGVINTIYGEGPTIISPLMKSGEIDVFAFIGSDKVADIIKKQHSSLKPLKSVLGLGAKNIGVVCEDADIELAIKECLLGSLSYNGQRCTAIKRIDVAARRAKIFADRIAQGVDALTLGMPWTPGVNITPIPDSFDSGRNVFSQMRYYQDLVDDALSKGAQVINKTGNQNIGTFFSPTVLYGVDKTMRIYHEEQFGPIVPISVFENIDESINAIAESKYGQQASIFSNNANTIAHFADNVINQVGRININSQCQRGPDDFPFGGRKFSAEGTLSVSDAPKVFSTRAMVAAKDNDANKQIINEILDNNKSQFLSTRQIL